MRLLQCVIRQVTAVTILYTPHLVSTQQQNMDTLVSIILSCYSSSFWRILWVFSDCRLHWLYDHIYVTWRKFSTIRPSWWGGWSTVEWSNADNAMEEYQSDIKDIISHNFLVWWHICPFLPTGPGRIKINAVAVQSFLFVHIYSQGADADWGQLLYYSHILCHNIYFIQCNRYLEKNNHRYLFLHLHRRGQFVGDAALFLVS